MIDITFAKNRDLYIKYKECLGFLRDIDDSKYEYPEEIVSFHVYTEARSPKELESIRSYIATQNLQKTKLIVWSDYDISQQENMQPYKDFVDLRVYSAHDIAKDTPLQGMDKYLKPLDDDRHWMNSGIMRFLVLYKFGGIYMDMDMVLIRDFKPILNQNFAYQWGSSTDFAKQRWWEEDCHGPCAAMLGANKGEKYIENCMDQLIRTPIRPRSTCFDEEMLGFVYRKDPASFTVFPTPFFNTEWLISKTSMEMQKLVKEGWFSPNDIIAENLYLESFAWHWHNSSNKHKEVFPGSKFALLQDRNDKKLKSMGVL
jgi:hypothetical protein